MVANLSLFDLLLHEAKEEHAAAVSEGERRKADGMASVLSHTPDDYKRAFAETVISFDEGREFTAEDVTERVGRPPEGTHFNCVGALISGLARRGFISDTGRMEKAKRVGMNATKLAVWKRTGKET